MNLAGLKKYTKDVEIQGQKFTLKKWPLGFSDYLTLKSAEGKEMEFQTIGEGKNAKRVVKKVLAAGGYTPELEAGQIFNGLEKWGLVDGDYALELTEGNCMALVREYPDLALELVGAIAEFNSGLAKEVKKN